MEKEKRNLYTFLFVVMIKRREVIAVADNVEEYIFAIIKLLVIFPNNNTGFMCQKGLRWYNVDMKVIICLNKNNGYQFGGKRQ